MLEDVWRAMAMENVVNGKKTIMDQSQDDLNCTEVIDIGDGKERFSRKRSWFSIRAVRIGSIRKKVPRLYFENSCRIGLI